MRTHSLEEFNAEAVRFASTLRKEKAATVVALSGELGSGKTTFVQAVARHFGVEESVTSPTFVLEKMYELPPDSARGENKFSRLIHIDAYRVEDASELIVIGWGKIARDPDNLILLEWPEHVSALIPDGASRIALTYIDENTRDISYGEEN